MDRLFPLSLLLATACASPLNTSTDWIGCENYDFDDPADPMLQAEAIDGEVIVSLTNVIQPADSDFEPEITGDGKKVEIREAWTGGDAEDDFCFTPRVFLEGARGKLQVYWFRPGEDIAFDNLEVEVD